MTDKIALEDRFIAFVDVVGYSDLSRKTGQGAGLSLEELRELSKVLTAPRTVASIREYGPGTCPESKHVRRDLGLQISQFADSVIASCEISPASIVNLIHICFDVCINLLGKGVMCRGYISRGQVYHDQNGPLGPGYVDIVPMEKQVSFWKRSADERGTPFIEISPVVVDYVDKHTDPCVREMFGRMTLQENNLTAVFPIQRLQHSFGLSAFGEKFDGEREKANNDRWRQIILDFRGKVIGLVDQANASAVQKGEHYLRALDRQLELCDVTDRQIDAFSRPVGLEITAERFPGLFKGIKPGDK